KCGSGHTSADLGYRGESIVCPHRNQPARSWMEKIFDLPYIDLVSEVNRRRAAMAIRDETITKKSGEGRETPPIVGVGQEPIRKINLRVPPAPPPSPADTTATRPGFSYKHPLEAGTSVNSDFSSWKANVSKFH
uniref:Myocilin opposite strand n=1 Tax=Cricetulus griseus TaxID=10029 RepID=A0A8C2N1U0_CRIGR